jgi:hypothetical protein
MKILACAILIHMKERFNSLLMVSIFSPLALISSFYLLRIFQYMRPIADDFCTSAVVVKDGFWAANDYWWSSWSGRFSFTAAVSLIESISVHPEKLVIYWFGCYLPSQLG